MSQPVMGGWSSSLCKRGTEQEVVLCCVWFNSCKSNVNQEGFNILWCDFEKSFHPPASTLMFLYCPSSTQYVGGGGGCPFKTVSRTTSRCYSKFHNARLHAWLPLLQGSSSSSLCPAILTSPHGEGSRLLPGVFPLAVASALSQMFVWLTHSSPLSISLSQQGVSRWPYLIWQPASHIHTPVLHLLKLARLYFYFILFFSRALTNFLNTILFLLTIFIAYYQLSPMRM